MVMSLEHSTKDHTEDRSEETMSATSHKAIKEPRPAIPVFSYAQAAKGKSAAPSTSLLNDKETATAENDTKDDATSPNKDNTTNSSESPTKRNLSDVNVAHGEMLERATEQQQAPPSEPLNGTKAESSSIPEPDATESQKPNSTPSSPDFGATSTSTLPKEEEMFSTGNGSSDSTWDKQSQASQNGNKNPEKPEIDKNSPSTVAWDEESPASISLKEAPPPPLNIWQQRKEAQEAKTKPKSTIPPQISNSYRASNGVGITNGINKSIDTSAEHKKQDAKKKGKISVEEKSAQDHSKGPVKDGKARNGEEGTEIHNETHFNATLTPSTSAKSPSTSIAPPPPPPGDAVSWPTPESAVGEEKKKSLERADKVEKEEPQAPKTNGKKGWTHVPFVPTAVFNTPLPPARRGGRPPGAGRDSAPRGRMNPNNGNSTEKPFLNTVTSTNRAPAGAAVTSSSASNTNHAKQKRASSAGPISTKEQRKQGEQSATERRKESDAGTSKFNRSRGASINGPRRTSNPVIPATPRIGGSAGRAPNNEAGQTSKYGLDPNSDEEKQKTALSTDTHAHPKNSGSERRFEGPMRSTESPKDFNNGSFPIRERGEGRPERGRGGHRGRGGNHVFFNSSNQSNGHAFSNGPASQYQAGPGPQSRSFSNHERLPSQSQGTLYSGPGGSQQGRNFRSGSRSQSIQHSAPFGRFSNAPHQGPPHLANLQTDVANMYGYQPGNQGIMSAMPFNPFVEPMSLWGMVSMQMEYYFSIENLCKDLFLRKHMDSQGFAFLSVLANFNRIKQLTTDLEMIRYVCLNSQHIEFRTGPDGIDRVRRRDGWEQWVISMDERDPSAQNDGPILQRPQEIQHASPQAIDARQGMSPSSATFNGPPDSTNFQPLEGVAPSSRPAAPVAPTTNGYYASTSPTPLSAAVSEFSPSLRSTGNRGFPTPDHHSQGANIFTDEQVDSLNVLVRTPVNAAPATLPPFHSSSSRTFSNGSIDGRTINDELSRFAERQSQATTNGDVSESLDLQKSRSRSPFPVGPSGHQMDSNVSPPVFWVKNKEKQTPLDSLPNELTYTSYRIFREDALRERKQSPVGKCHSDMHNLYQFWAHFLIRNFNTSMYDEFRRIAFDDAAQRECIDGMRSLMQYYDESLLGQKVVPDENIARDFVELVKSENTKTERPAFKKLRTAWRNGAFNHKNRAKILKMIDANLKQELDR